MLGYKEVSRTLLKLDSDEKLTRQFVVSGQKRDMSCINESGLYTLILRSNKPEAKRFKRWVTSEVLPAIRKQGFYSAKKSMEPAQINMETLYERLEKKMEDIVEDKISRHLINQRMEADYLTKSVDKLIEQTDGLVSFYNNVKGIPSFEKFTDSHKKLYAEIEQIKRLICYENPTLFKKDLNMYVEDIELFLSIASLLSSKENEKIKVNDIEYYYFDINKIVENFDKDSMVLMEPKIENLFKKGLFEKLVLKGTGFDYVAFTNKALEIIKTSNI